MMAVARGSWVYVGGRAGNKPSAGEKSVITAACAWFYGLFAALIVAFIAALATALGKLALDSIVQQEIGEEIRSSAFAVSETLHQLSWVAGGLAGVRIWFDLFGRDLGGF